MTFRDYAETEERIRNHTFSSDAVFVQPKPMPEIPRITKNSELVRDRVYKIYYPDKIITALYDGKAQVFTSFQDCFLSWSREEKNGILCQVFSESDFKGVSENEIVLSRYGINHYGKIIRQTDREYYLLNNKLNRHPEVWTARAIEWSRHPRRHG